MAKGEKKASPRIADIAAVAGVSVATASNVLAGRRQVNSEAGRRVLEIAEQMGYTRPAQKNGRKRIRFVIYKKHGLVVMDTPFFAEMIAGIERECRLFGYELMITYIHMQEGEAARERIADLTRDESAGILLLATEMDGADLAPFLCAQSPLLVLDSLFPLTSVNTVVMDNVEAGRMATEKLLSLGHRRVGFIGSSLPFHNMRDRYEGYARALETAGIAALEGDVFLVEPTMEGAFRDMAPLLAARAGNLPTAYFAANDILAVGAARAMKKHGMKLPRDASIIGMDDMPICQVVSPQLSTVAVPKGGIGGAAVRRLIQMIETPDGLYMKTLVGISLVMRESVRAYQS